MKVLVYIWGLISILLFTSCKQEQQTSSIPEVEFLVAESYDLGELQSILAKFKSEVAIDRRQVKLFLEAGVHRVTLIPTDCESGHCVFNIPEVISNKTGLSQWRLSFKDNPVDSGIFQVLPAETSDYSINTYIGPPSAKAGKAPATWAVSIPKDAHDNLIRNSDSVTVDYRYLNEQFTKESGIHYGLSFIELDAGSVAGYLQLGSYYKGAKAKATQFIVMPNEAVDFELQLQAEHDIADGQQELEVLTSIIRDRFGNTIANGTHVHLQIDQSNGVTNYVSAITANGIARFAVLHPDEAMTWKLQASINNGAISNPTTLYYRAFMDSFPVRRASANRLDVGPITGRLNDRVTDGISVRLYDAKNTLLVERQTRNGMVYFDLSELYESPKLPLRITTMGVNQTVE